MSLLDEALARAQTRHASLLASPHSLPLPHTALCSTKPLMPLRLSGLLPSMGSGLSGARSSEGSACAPGQLFHLAIPVCCLGAPNSLALGMVPLLVTL